MLFNNFPPRFKPVEMATLVYPVKEKFEGLFRKTFSAKKNQEFLINLQVICMSISIYSVGGGAGRGGGWAHFFGQIL